MDEDFEVFCITIDADGVYEQWVVVWQEVARDFALRSIDPS